MPGLPIGVGRHNVTRDVIRVDDSDVFDLTPLNMAYIPEEILDKIIGCAAEGQAGQVSYVDEVVRPKFPSYASVSHTFHQIVLPYKFRSLTFEFDSITYFRSSTTLNPIPKFCEAIIAGDPHALSLAPLVQELSLHYWRGKKGLCNDIMLEPLEKIINGAISFRNLTNLTMQRCVTSPAIMEKIGKLVQLQSLQTLCCKDGGYGDKVSYDALSNLRSLHTLECGYDGNHFEHHLASIPINNLRVLKNCDSQVIKLFLTSDPPVQLKELWLSNYYWNCSLLLNYLPRVTSLTHLSLEMRDYRPENGPPFLKLSFPELQYLRIHVAIAPHFADQPMKRMRIDTKSNLGDYGMEEVRRHWQGTVFPHVEYLETDRNCAEMDEIPIEFWREFLLNVIEVRCFCSTLHCPTDSTGVRQTPFCHHLSSFCHIL
jgi:hypothetical protein